MREREEGEQRKEVDDSWIREAPDVDDSLYSQCNIVWRLDVPALAPCHAVYIVQPVSPVIVVHRIVALVPLPAPRLMMTSLAPLPVTVKV